ncbi:MAG: GNAT family N-acetyltransferase, partial [Candidatus Eisenbacteria bacterium]|nr:GNAT family N-acetyltransferase [Candidatus Eisenbacteria bacterium]
MRRPPEIHVAPTTAADLPDLMALWNDGRVMRWVGFPDGLGYDEARIARWFAGISAKPDRRHWTVRSPDVGFCGELYAEIDRVHRRAGLDIKFRPDAQGCGRSAAAMLSLIDGIFETEPEVHAV